jgi:hypothetical protein
MNVVDAASANWVRAESPIPIKQGRAGAIAASANARTTSISKTALAVPMIPQSNSVANEEIDVLSAGGLSSTVKISPLDSRFDDRPDGT